MSYGKTAKHLALYAQILIDLGKKNVTQNNVEKLLKEKGFSHNGAVKASVDFIEWYHYNVENRKKKTRKKNPENEIRELILFAEKHEPLSNQFYLILKNLEKKAKKGTYDPVLAAKLWKYWIDNAVKEYNYEFLTRKRSLVQNVFSVQDRKDAAVQVEAQWRDDVFRGDNPSHRKKKTTRKKNPKSNSFSVFRIKNGKVDFYGGVGTWGHTMSRALLWRTKADANAALESGYDPKYQHGIAPADATPAQILAAVKKRASSARGKARRSNPVGPTQKEVDRAANLFRDFTGDHPEGLQSVKLPVPKTGLVIGELDGVLYTTVRDGKTEKYQHDFKKSSRPHLIASSDGKSLHVLGGEYEFTERGIEDR